MYILTFSCKNVLLYKIIFFPYIQRNNSGITKRYSVFFSLLGVSYSIIFDHNVYCFYNIQCYLAFF